MRPTPLKILMKLIQKEVSSDELIHGAAIDSRLVKPGDLFFAIKGNRQDGHNHLAEVAAKHGIGAVVDQTYQGPSYGLVLIPVPNVTLALQQLATRFLASQEVTVIGITGSIGKTTTKEFAKTLIGSSYKLFASPLSYNSQLTVPISILSSRGDEEILLLEMGMSEPGNLKRLIEIAPPDIALITTIALQHADQFENGLEGIAAEKGTLFSHPKTRLGLYHKEMPYANQVAQIGPCEKKTFSINRSDSDFALSRSGEDVTIYERGAPSYSFPLHLPMRAYDHNFLAALSLARVLDIPWPVLCEAARWIRPPPMRFETVEQGGITFINDAYNANPDAMIAAFASLPKPKQGGRTIGVISEMNALGKFAQEGHRQVGEAALQSIDCLFCIGNHCAIIQEMWRANNRSCGLFKTMDELKKQLIAFVKPGDVVLLKGARAYALDALLKENWNDTNPNQSFRI